MTTDEQLRDAFDKRFDGIKQAQLRWVTVEKVDKSNRTMDVMGVVDQLEYYGVQLGLGAICIYPKHGTTCLVGIIEGQETDTFLISAEQVDEIVLNEGTLGGMVKVNELTDRLNLIEKDINSLKQSLAGWSPIPNDGGSALKAVLSSYSSSSLIETQVKDIENERVQQ